MLINDLLSKGLIMPPKWLADNTAYLTKMGSTVYGCSNDESDIDVYGFCLPPKEITFPHLAGEVQGFGRQIQRFGVWQEHHVRDESAEYDISVFSIVKFFQLCMENNPNMLDALMSPRSAVLHMSNMAQVVRDNRRLFVHKGCYNKFRGYAMSQMAKIRSKTAPSNTKRLKSVQTHGYDVKYAFHLVRLCLQCEQLLETGDMILDKDAALYRKIRAGEWTLEYLEQWFEEKEKHLEGLLNKSVIPFEPDEEAIKDLLLKCLESHYGNLEKAVVRQTDVSRLVADMTNLIARYQ